MILPRMFPLKKVSWVSEGREEDQSRLCNYLQILSSLNIKAAKDITSQTPPSTPELQFQRDPLDDRRGIQFQGK